MNVIWHPLAYFAAIVGACIVLILAMVIKDFREFKTEAVKRGFATWVSDENGNTTFTWKEPTP